jgi:polysaccharide export outer membrane protein
MEIVERMKMSRVVFCLPILALWMIAPGFLMAQEQIEPGAGPAADAYEVQPGDLLFISVWKEEELQKEVLVRPDGAFSFPLCGQIDGRNKTVEDLRVEISGRLSRFIPDLIVTVSVLEINGNKVYVIGQVNEPGQFVVNPRVDVMQALSMAGGATAFAKLNDIKILRRVPGGQVAIEFRYDDVVRGRNLEQNILLDSGDVVVVP